MRNYPKTLTPKNECSYCLKGIPYQGECATCADSYILANRFLNLVNDELKKCGEPDYFTYSKNTYGAFWFLVDRMPAIEIAWAIECVQNDDWDQSEFIMAFEGPWDYETAVFNSNAKAFTKRQAKPI